MGLQLRVTDPLGGGRLIDLDDRAADRPHLIGLDPLRRGPGRPRAARPATGSCSSTTANGSSRTRMQAGTFRNGKQVTGPTPIFLGDVITLGRGDGAVELTVSGLNVGATPTPAQAPAEEAVGPA